MLRHCFSTWLTSGDNQNSYRCILLITDKSRACTHQHNSKHTIWAWHTPINIITLHAEHAAWLGLQLANCLHACSQVSLHSLASLWHEYNYWLNGILLWAVLYQPHYASQTLTVVKVRSITLYYKEEQSIQQSCKNQASCDYTHVQCTCSCIMSW